MEKHPNNLKRDNAHARDANIKFWEEGHRYEITSDPGEKYTSVTTWAHSHFPKFNSDKVIKNMMKGKNWNESNKYWGLSPKQIKDQWSATGKIAATAGTKLHERIECFMNNDALENGYTHENLAENISLDDSDAPEWKYFIDFVKDFPNLKPYRTEWTIHHEGEKLAGTIDMVYENEDGSLSIYDWKRCKEIVKTNNWGECATNPVIYHLPSTNYWHYSLQLNTYRKILEDKYGKNVKELFLVRLYPDNEKYELIEVPLLETEMKELFKS